MTYKGVIGSRRIDESGALPKKPFNAPVVKFVPALIHRVYCLLPRGPSLEHRL